MGTIWTKLFLKVKTQGFWGQQERATSHQTTINVNSECHWYCCGALFKDQGLCIDPKVVDKQTNSFCSPTFLLAECGNGVLGFVEQVYGVYCYHFVWPPSLMHTGATQVRIYVHISVCVSRKYCYQWMVACLQHPQCWISCRLPPRGASAANFFSCVIKLQ